MSRPAIAVLAWLPDGLFEQLASQHPEFDWLDGRQDPMPHLSRASIVYGLPPVENLASMPDLKWIQLISAGVPWDLCPAARERNVVVTNLRGLYGPSIAEHAFMLLLMLARNIGTTFRNQLHAHWDRTIAPTLFDLRGKTLGIVGLGDIGRATARLGRAFGMRIVGCRRQVGNVPEADRVYPLSELHSMLAECDAVVVAAPLIKSTEGMLGSKEFAAMKRRVLYVNVSRGGIAQEPALLDALWSGQVAGAGLEVFTTEPLPREHPLWTMPQVIIVPHLAGEITNLSARPAERFNRNLHAWVGREVLEGVVDLNWGY